MSILPEPRSSQEQRIEAILAATERERREAGDESNHFTAVNEQQLRSTNKPVVAWQSWPATVRNVLTYFLGVANPTATKHEGLFAQVYVTLMLWPSGPGQSGPQTYDFDRRFGALTLPHYPGLTLEPGSMHTLAFTMSLEHVERGNYPGRCVLFSAGWHGSPAMTDTANFVFQVMW